MTRQFIACTFRPGDARAYTYAYDGDEPLSVGDVVLVAGRNGEGTKKVHVAVLGVPEPTDFEAKPILEKFVPTEKPDLMAEGEPASKMPF